MPAYFDTGFCVRQASWHGQENLLADYPENWDEARMAAGLMWEPEARPVYIGDGNGSAVLDPAHKAIVRDDTGLVLSVQSDAYSIITHADMGRIADAIVESDTNVRYETAGSVKDGRLVWSLIRLDEPFTVPGDDTATYPYLALLTSHDGSAATKALYTYVRVVCYNTWQAASAEGDRSGAQYVFRHTGDVQSKIDDAVQSLAGLRSGANDYRAMCEHLASINVDDALVKTFLTEFIPSPEDHGVKITDRVRDNIANARGAFMGVYEASPTTDAVRGNAYGLLMAATEYSDHIRGYQPGSSTYLGRTILGEDAKKREALSLIEDLCAV